MEKSIEELLEKHGWVVCCYSPFEASHEESNSSMSGHLCEAILVESCIIDEEAERYGDIQDQMDGEHIAMIGGETATVAKTVEKPIVANSDLF